ncbi:MAG: transmembrane 220 family protein [Kiloniellales bacterium]|nr:transmembrane 220 family protein [Kiloniellales bacterium]
MRYVNGFLCLLMVLFAAVQYNDPDAALWVPMYLVPAAWAGLAAFRPHKLRNRLPSLALAACTALAVVAAIVLWPQDEGWWRQEVWWESEPAREGMGLMVVVIVMLVVGLTWSRMRRDLTTSG